MKRFLTTLLVLGAIIVAVGFYRGWFTVNHQKLDSDQQKATATFKHNVNKAKNAVDKTENAPAK